MTEYKWYDYINGIMDYQRYETINGMTGMTYMTEYQCYDTINVMTLSIVLL